MEGLDTKDSSAVHKDSITDNKNGESRLYFRQLLSGRDFAREDPIASQMKNFVYLIGDGHTHEAIIVDPAYGVSDLLEYLATDDMTCAGVLGTHYHPDHVGGDLASWSVEGISRLLELIQVPIHVQTSELAWVERTTGVGASDLVGHDSGDFVVVGNVSIELIHTPGHTPGSQCFLVENRLISGDTLFLDGCGRTDLPGSDPEAMYESLTTRLDRVPDSAILFPGHQYSRNPSASMGDTRENNFVFKPKSAKDWLEMFGA